MYHVIVFSKGPITLYITLFFTCVSQDLQIILQYLDLSWFELKVQLLEKGHISEPVQGIASTSPLYDS